VRRQYLVEGEVQGVGYRYFAVRSAHRLGLRGWVRNLADGRVEVLAEGTPDQLARFEADLRRGPSMATVTNVHSFDVSDEAELPEFFRIK
jgi:acylphosphatase